MKLRRSNIKDIHRLWIPAALVPASAWLLAYLFGLTEDGWWQIMIFLAASAMGIIAWARIDWGGQLAQFVSFGAILLLVPSLTHLFYALDIVFNGPRFAEWPIMASRPALALFKGEILSVLGILLTISAWLLAGGKMLHPGQLFDLDRGVLSISLWVLYAVAITAIAVQWVAGSAAAVLGQLPSTAAELGTVSSLALPLLRYRQRLPRLIFALVLSAPFILVALGSGMKQELIFAAIPIGFILWTSWNSAGERALLVILAIIFLAFTTIYVNYYRDLVWRGKVDSPSQLEVLQEFTSTTSQIGIGESLIEGVESFARRANASNYRAWAVAIADDRGFHPDMVFSPIAFVFIPRFMWPEKPAIRQGWEFMGMIHGDRYKQILSSSTAAGLYPGLYLGGGYTAVFAGALTLGFMFAFLAKLAVKLGGRLFSSIFLFSLVPFIIRLDEQWTVQAFAAPIIMFVYSFAIYIGVVFIARIHRPGKVAMGRNRPDYTGKIRMRPHEHP